MTPGDAPDAPLDVAPGDLAQAIDAAAPPLVVDVRTDAERLAGALGSAHAVDRAALLDEVIRLDPSGARAVVVVCARGVRSRIDAARLRAVGRDARSLLGGFAAWRKAGLPVAPAATALPPDRVERHLRHLRLPEVGEAGVLRLARARALVIGAGGLGSPALLYLVAAGVGHVTIADPDRVELSNLQRQVLHTTASVGTPKVESAARALTALDPAVSLELLPERLDAARLAALVAGFDVVLDGSDNLATRYAASDAAAAHGVPLVHGSVHRFEGRLTVFDPGRGGPCYRCLYPDDGAADDLAPACDEVGVLGVLPGVLGALCATEALKILLGVGDVARGRLVVFDALALRFHEITLRRDPRCACSARPTTR